jgi:hypothetical protein
MSSLDTFFCLDAASDFYVNLHILEIEIQKATSVRVETVELAQIAKELCSSGFLRRLRYNVEKQFYEPFCSDSVVGEMDWFEITQEGRAELDRLFIEQLPSTASQ